MSTQQDPIREVSLAFVLQIEAMDRQIREAIERLKDALLIQVTGTSERGPNRATRHLPATPGPNPPAALVPFLTGYTLLARLLVALLSRSVSMTEAEQSFGYFRRAIASVEEAARLRHRQEPEDDGREADME
ncbi:hypothetical protein PoHVEF18_007490 [Penicillium ochrochloron]